MSFQNGLRGPKPVNIGELLFWEGIWFNEVFLPLRDGIPGVLIEETEDSPRPPRLPTRTPYDELNRERLRDWRKRDKAYLAEMRKGRVAGTRRYWTASEPGEPHLWEILKQARTPKEVRRAYAVSNYWFNPKWHARVYVSRLYEHADLIIAAKKDPRYPRANRPSSDDKRLEFFAAAMAGITLDRSPLTSLNLLRKHKHSKTCLCRRCHTFGRHEFFSLSDV